MAWKFLDKILFIDRGLVNAVKCSTSALDGWNGSDEVYNISYANILQLGDVKVSRDIGSQSYGLNNTHDSWIHFYNEGNNWYYRALVIYKNGSDVVHYTQLTQSYDLEFYYGIAVNDDTGRSALIQVTVNKNSGDYTAATAWFYASGTFDFSDFYGAFRTGDEYYGSQGAGAGSGYIGNSLLSNKKMVGYNVPTSDVESTKTESVNVYSASGESNKPKAGDGKVKIKLVKEAKWVTLESILKDTSGLDSHYKKSSVATPSLSVASIYDLTSYYGTDWSLKGGTGYGMIYSDGEFKNQGQYSSDTWFLPLKKTYKVLGFRGKAKIQDKNSQWDLISIKCDICNGNTIQEVGEGLVLGKVPTDDDSYGTYRFVEITGNDYNDFSWTLDHFIGATGQYGTDVNYIMLGMATRLEWIKDLECLVIEVG